MQITLRPDNTLTVAWLTLRYYTAGVTFPISGDALAQFPTPGEQAEMAKYGGLPWSTARARLARRIQEFRQNPVPEVLTDVVDAWEQVPLFQEPLSETVDS